MSAQMFEFQGRPGGAWRVLASTAIIGGALATCDALDIVPVGFDAARPQSGWVLRGVRSNERYVAAAERDTLARRQAGLGRPEASMAALIPIRKSAAWWALAQDERRAILEEHSHHIAIGLEYLPAVARRLYHCRDIGEPFDFLTWFEFAPEHVGAFDDLLARLRATPEWTYVDHEVELRLMRAV